jgi:signal transduction histidine kinase
MQACSLDQEEETSDFLAAHATDAKMASRMRLVLAASVVLAVLIDPAGLSSVNRLTGFVLLAYLSHSIVVYVYSQLDHRLSQSRLVHWLDVVWFAMIVGLTGSGNSFFFLFFFFAILVSSFRWGLEEGARVTMASALLFAAAGLLQGHDSELPRLLLRTTFLLALGYLCVYWGESKVRLMRQLALLRDVSRLSNPRFGVDHTLTSILKKTCAFFKASTCVLIMQDKESGACFLRTFRAGDTAPSLKAQAVAPEAAAPFMAFAQDRITVFSQPSWPAMAPLSGESMACDSEGRHWARDEQPSASVLADMMEARAFISAPVILRRQQGRLYVFSQNKAFDKAEALFLNHMAAQAFPVIENIELLDKMASEAAAQERQKMSLDLHDTAIQPYIGLKLGLSALRNKAAADNPLVGDLDRLMVMTEKVVADLRQYARTLKAGSRSSAEPVFLMALRQQAAQVREFYGVDIGISMKNDIAVSDRLSTEALQLVREGLANICKHTQAQHGLIEVECVNGWLRIQIENDSTDAGAQVADFLPRSLSERAAGLGGRVHVRQIPQGNTVVEVEIPV